MRDIIKILTAGSILTGYALLAPTLVEAFPAQDPAPKAFGQRLVQAGGEAPVSAVAVFRGSRRTVATRSALPTSSLRPADLR